METYELIDSDPKFSRVVRYFRASDYLTLALGTIGAPGLMVLFEKIEPAKGNTFKMPPPSIMRIATTIGFFGGFYYAYTSSTKRFWGYSENAREVAKDRYEVKKALSEKKSPYGSSLLTPYQQDMSARNSTNSQLLLSLFPWFNVANHQSHGIDLRKYYEVREGEENWNFTLPPLDQVKDLDVAQFKEYSNYP